MMEFTKGDLLAADVEALVNTVNCVGIMGRGVALQFKNAFPDNFKAYARACDLGEVQAGRMFVFPTRQVTNPHYIINFPTKRHWRGKSRMEDIESGLVALKSEIVERGIKSIALPPLGSGLGGLPWADVRERIVSSLADLQDVRVLVFEPLVQSEPQPRNYSRDVPTMTKGRASLVVLMDAYMASLIDPFLSLLEVHKLMYFLQEAGEPLNLKFQKATYGPYAENLRHVLHAVEGHLIAGYHDGGDAPDKRLELVPGAVDEAVKFLSDVPGTVESLRKVTQAVHGFETPFGLELLSTVHWVIKKDGARTADDAIEATYAWGDRKRQFNSRQIRLAFDVLQAKGWLGQPVAS